MKRIHVLTSLFVSIVLLAGCGNTTSTTTQTSVETSVEIATESIGLETTEETIKEEPIVLQKLIIAEPLHSIGYLPLYVADHEGYFTEQGLEIEIIQATGGTHVTSVITGDAWGVIGGVDSNAIANASGNCPEPVISVVNCVNRANVYLCAAVGQEYTGSSEEDLAEFFKGKTINTGRFGGSPNLCIRYMLLSIGLDPDKDVTLMEPADTSTSVALVQTGQADISWATEPQIMEGIEQNVWTDAFYKFTDLGDYSYSVLSVGKSTIENDPETVQKFVNAIMKALKAVDEDRELAIANAVAEFPTTSQEGIEAAIDRAYADKLWSVDGFISVEAVDSDMAVSIASEVYTSEYQYSDLVDMQFVEAASK